MTVLHSGTTKKYSENFTAAFGKAKKTAAAKKPAAAKKKTAKKGKK